jgi:7,8-dihydropterin-6-yl-methyl-4-(beta-D-ribofuranosyl)aminobenzene 5'-phosphate synthase
MKKYLTLTLLLAVLASVSGPGVGAEPEEKGAAVLRADDVKITVLYDNNPGPEGLKAEWGFACLIEGAEKRILFDTGGNPASLLANMDSLSIDPGSFDIIVLSHSHYDHTGGVHGVLEKNSDVKVFVPESFMESFKRKLSEAGAEVIEVEAPVDICAGVSSVGQMGESIKEQSLILSTDRGLIVITGCAHPGIVSIVDKAREVTGESVLFAMGGFHVALAGDKLLNDLIEGFRAAGVAYAAPCHCSGDRARHLFAEAFGENYVELAVGSVVYGRDLK